MRLEPYRDYVTVISTIASVCLRMDRKKIAGDPRNVLLFNFKKKAEQEITAPSDREAKEKELQETFG